MSVIGRVGHGMSSKFYTFYDFSYHNGSPPFRPLIDNRLRNNIETLAKLHSKWQEFNYVEYFCSIFLHNSESHQKKRLAHLHLVAYIDLDRCCMIWRNFYRFPLYAAKSEEYHALTNEILWQPEKLTKYLEKYNPENKKKASVKTYLISILKNEIRANLNLRSDWNILCNVDINSLRKINNFGQKLRIALAKYGLQEPNISQYIFAWQYFVPVYKNNLINNPNNQNERRWSNPGNLEFQETANYYNQQRFNSSAPLQVASGKEVTAEMIEQWMQICIKALRQAEVIIEVSRDADSYEKQIEESNDRLILEEQNKERFFLKEEDLLLKQKIEKIEATLDKISSRIPQIWRRAIMLLCYPHQLAILNQEQLASLLDVNQGTISRFISRYIENPLVDILGDLRRQKLDIDSYINTFLLERFANPDKSKILDILLVEALEEDLSERQQYILKLYYGQKMNIREIGLVINSDRSVALNEINTSQKILQELLTQKIDKWQKKYIKLWLRNYYRNKMQNILLKGLDRLNELDQIGRAHV